MWNLTLDLGVLIGLLTATVGGLWSVRKMLKAKRAEQATWLHKLSVDFYLREEFRPLRKMVEYGDPKMTELIERRVSRRDLAVSVEEAEALCSLDSFLNYLELLFTLEHEGQLHERGRDALFRYWNDVLCSPHNAGLRRYLSRLGFEAVSEALPYERIGDTIDHGEEYFALYGSLTRLGGKQEEAGVQARLTYVQDCLIPGDLLDLGDYPGLVEGPGQVKAELYRSRESETFRLLDEFERFKPGSSEESLFARRCVWLPTCKRDCWVYYYEGTVGGSERIQGNSWKEYITAQRDQQTAIGGEHRAEADG